MKTEVKVRGQSAVGAWEAAAVELGDLDVADVEKAVALAGRGYTPGSIVVRMGLQVSATGGTAYARAYRGRARAGTSVVDSERTTYDESGREDRCRSSECELNRKDAYRVSEGLRLGAWALR